jgi:hypothetical protein
MQFALKYIFRERTNAVRIRKALLMGFLLISSPAVLFAQSVNVLSAQEKA